MTAAKGVSKTRKVATKPRPGEEKTTKKRVSNTKPGKKTASSRSKAVASAPKPKSLQKKGGMPPEGKDPKGGLTAAGRKYFEEKEGLHVKPGVKGAADTPEKMLRKGSFLRRHYANPRGPVVDAKGNPTRQALQAFAWGEPVPKNEEDEKRLAKEGAKLLEQYHDAKGDQPKKRARMKRPRAGE